MRPEQRKAVLVLLNLLHRDLPSLDGVALLATGAELPLVNIGVAIRALRAYICEHRLGVALRAGDALMHPAQGKTGLVVVEFRDTSNRFPPALGVAILAGNIQRSVRAAGHCRSRGSLAPH